MFDSEKGEYITKYPVRAGLIRTLQALIPAILVGIAIVVLSQGFHNAWHWTVHHSSAIAQFIRYGIPAIAAVSVILTGSIAHIKHYKYYVKSYEKEQELLNENLEQRQEVKEKLEKNEYVSVVNDRVEKYLLEIKEVNNKDKNRIECSIFHFKKHLFDVYLSKSSTVCNLKDMIALELGLIHGAMRPEMCLKVKNTRNKKIKIANEKCVNDICNNSGNVLVYLD